MSEDYSFNRDQKKEEESCIVPDFSGSLGKGMLAKEKIETLGNSSGLTPLVFDVNNNNKNMDRNTKLKRTGRNSVTVSSYGVRMSSLLNCLNQYTENTEIFNNSSDLTPFHPSGEIHSIKKKSVSSIEGFSKNEDLETLRHSSGLTPLNYDSEPQMNADERRYSPQRTLRAQSSGLINIVYKGE